MSSAATFWDKIAAGYAKRPVGDQAAYEHKLAKTQEYFRPDMKVLEMACGTGTTALHHASHVGQYRAVDISSEMIRIARAKEGAEAVQFEVADFDALHLPPESLDMIQGHSILHLLPDPRATLKKSFAALKPGGTFVSSTVCVKRLWWLKLIAPIARALGKFPPLKFYAADDIRKMMVEAGFEIEYDWQPKPKSLVVFLIAKKPE